MLFIVVVLQKLSSVGRTADCVIGSLIGVYEAENVHLIGCSLCRENDVSNIYAELDRTLTYLPAGKQGQIDLMGKMHTLVIMIIKTYWYIC